MRPVVLSDQVGSVTHMLTSLAVENYRSLRRLVMPLHGLNVVTGANGTGKSSLYRALRLLADASRNGAVAALADTPHTAVRSAGNATLKRDRTQLRTSSTKKLSWAANRSSSNDGEYSLMRAISSGSSVR